MIIIRENITLGDLKAMAEAMFGDMVKAVVDIERGIIAVDAELHSDLEALLIKDGSKPGVLWGVNLYPEKRASDFIEYDSLINIRPSVGNRSRGVENDEIRRKIADLAGKIVGQ